ncbi:MAG TPA: ABC transporter substrate-binding protein [Pseudolabrys sp.]|nr:ABC transporter substrate-binding protein [Pseudolabrys sp.]
MCRRITVCVALTALIAATFAAAPAQAEPGVGKDVITFGQIAALEGPAQALGRGMRDGILAAFSEANRAGGVNGRKLELKSVDDGYEPENMIEAINKMVSDGVTFALVGAVGTPTAKAGQPIATAAKLPFIGPFTGAEFLRTPYNRYVVNVRASYFQETEAWIEHLTNDLGLRKIAILYQDDTFGMAGVEGVKRALDKRHLPLTASGSFKRNTVAVKTALLDIMKARPEAVVTVAPYKPVAEFVKLARQVKLDATFVAISFVGSEALAAELADRGTGVVVSQVVPLPWDTSLPVVAAYQAALKAASPDSKPGFVSLEGYLVGRLVVDALKRIPGEPTREALLDAVSGGTFDFGGVKLRFAKDSNQGSNDVYFTVLQPDGSFRAVKQLAKPVLH